MTEHENSPAVAGTMLEKLKELSTMKRVRYDEDVALAAAIVLLEVASSDHVIDKFERSIIHTGLKNLFKVSDESATAVIAEATNHLRNMRGSSSEAALLKDVLDPLTKVAIAELIDKLIATDGEVQGIEIYLRRKFRTILGLPVESEQAASS